MCTQPVQFDGLYKTYVAATYTGHRITLMCDDGLTEVLAECNIFPTYTPTWYILPSTHTGVYVDKCDYFLFYFLSF